MKLSIRKNRLKVELGALEKILAAKTSFEVPLEHIQDVTTEAPQTSLRDIRAPGTHIPGVIRAGTYHTTKGREFWYVTRSKNYLIIELRDEPYKRIILGLNNSECWKERIIDATKQSKD